MPAAAGEKVFEKVTPQIQPTGNGQVPATAQPATQRGITQTDPSRYSSVAIFFSCGKLHYLLALTATREANKKE